MIARRSTTSIEIVNGSARSSTTQTATAPPATATTEEMLAFLADPKPPPEIPSLAEEYRDDSGVDLAHVDPALLLRLTRARMRELGNESRATGRPLAALVRVEIERIADRVRREATEAGADPVEALRAEVRRQAAEQAEDEAERAARRQLDALNERLEREAEIDRRAAASAAKTSAKTTRTKPPAQDPRHESWPEPSSPEDCLTMRILARAGVAGPKAFKDDGWGSMRCAFPLRHRHGDKAPSAAVNWRADIYHCAGCGDIKPKDLAFALGGSWTEIVAEFLGAHRGTASTKAPPSRTAEPAPKDPREDTRLPLPDEAHVEQARRRLLDDAHLVERICASWGTTREVLESVGAGWDPEFRLYRDGRASPMVVLPMRDPLGRLVNYKGIPLDGGGKKLNWHTRSDVPFGSTGKQLWPIDILRLPGDILLCEGEKDVLAALAHGLTAITVTGGASASIGEDWTPLIRRRDVALVLDVDKPGRDGAAKKIDELSALGCRVRNVVLPDLGDGTGKDLRDWLQGRTVSGRAHDGDELRRIIADAPIEKPRDEPPTGSAPAEPLAARITRIVDPETLRVTRERPYLIKGLMGGRGLQVIAGDPGSGKSFWAQHVAIERACDGGKVLQSFDVTAGSTLIIESEGDEEEFLGRFALLAGGRKLARPIHVWFGPFDWRRVDELIEFVRTEAIDWVVIDPLRLHIGQETDDVLTPWLRDYAIRLQVETKSLVTLIHHLRKPQQDKKGHRVEADSLYGARGPSALVGHADEVWISEGVLDRRTRVRCGKARYGSPTDRELWIQSFDLTSVGIRRVDIVRVGDPKAEAQAAEMGARIVEAIREAGGRPVPIRTLKATLHRGYLALQPAIASLIESRTIHYVSGRWETGSDGRRQREEGYVLTETGGTDVSEDF